MSRIVANDTTITIRPKGTTAGDWIFFVVLTAMCAAGIRTFPKWLADAGWGTRIFFGFLAIFVSVTLLRITLGIFWKLRGREELVVSRDAVEVLRRCGPIRFASRYSRAEVSNPRTRSQRFGTRAPEQHFMCFDAQGKVIDVGTQLTPEEASEAASELARAISAEASR